VAGTIPSPGTASGRLRRTRFTGQQRIPVRALLTGLHAVAVLAVVEALVRWVTLPRLARMLDVRIDLSPSSPTTPLQLCELPPRSARQVRCTQRVADVWPLSKGPCLRRSLVIGHLLRRHHPAIRLGVAGAGDELVAHAWVEIDGHPLEDVTGFHAFQRSTLEAAR
jgi:hypothetical protein